MRLHSSVSLIRTLLTGVAVFALSGCGGGNSSVQNVIDDMTVVSIGSVTVIEGNAGTVSADFPVTLSAPASTETMITFTVADGTGTYGDADYEPPVTTSIVILAGANTGTISVDVYGDTMVEPNENFTVTLDSTSNGILGSVTGTASISNDDTSGEGNLVWSEEFEGNSLDASKWNIETGYGPNNAGWGNDESQLYMNSSDNLLVEGGNLIITARCDSGVCVKRNGSITSAKINTKDKFEFRYGKVKARIKVPSGRSTWPAFWMLGANYPETSWPQSGEIDIMEVNQTFSNINTTHFTTHYFDDAASPEPGWRYFSQSRNMNEPLSDDFHVFEMDWDKDKIVGKIDGITYYSKAIESVNTGEFLKEFYMILNVAIDGTLGGDPDQIRTTPQAMLVDWVRVYESDSANSDTGNVSGTVFDGGLILDGDFEGGTGNWAGSGANIVFDENNQVNSANVASAGNAYDVNLGQVLAITNGRSYILSFKAKTEGNRSMIAGIGLNEAPWTNDTELVTLTSNWQTFEYTLSASNFGGNNSRVFFDMGADTGLVLIDDVSLIEVVPQ